MRRRARSNHPAKGSNRTPGHELNAIRQGDDLEHLTGRELELLTNPLGNHDLILRGYGGEIHRFNVAPTADRSGKQRQ
jgi:hypothetical protein